MMRLALLLISLLSTVSLAEAESLAQLTIDGRIDISGGARVEIKVGALRQKDMKAHEVSLGVHLAEGTTGADVIELLSARLRLAGIMVMAVSRSGIETDSPHLFIEATRFIQVRMASGLTTTITTCEAAPASLRVLSSDVSSAAGRLTMTASTWHMHTEKAGTSQLAIDLLIDQHGSAVAESLFKVAMKAGWIGERISADEWAPSRMVDGSRARGMSIKLESKADWGLRVEFPVQR
ncbi:MAG: hypothetical protein ACI841_000910 [Planctomycetota bacterium]|jgi:hypothetical protein